MERITPGNIKAVLKMKNNKSAPFEDGVMYGFLKNMPSTHHILATIYNKILLRGCAAEIWIRG